MVPELYTKRHPVFEIALNTCKQTKLKSRIMKIERFLLYNLTYSFASYATSWNLKAFWLRDTTKSKHFEHSWEKFHLFYLTIFLGQFYYCYCWNVLFLILSYIFYEVKLWINNHSSTERNRILKGFREWVHEHIFLIKVYCIFGIN